MTGSTRTAQSHRAEAAALVDELSDDELSLRLDAAAWLAAAELYLDLYAEADAHAGRALSARSRDRARGRPLVGLYQILPRVWYVRGKLAEAVELLDGGIEAARLLGTPPALAGQPLQPLGRRGRRRRPRSSALDDRRGGRRARARPRRRLRHGLGCGEARRRPARNRATGTEPSTCSLGRAGGEELTLIPGGWRAYCLELLTRCWLALGSPQRGRARGQPRRGHGRHRAAAARDRLGRPRRRRRRPARGELARAADARTRLGRCRSGGRSPHRGSAVAHARRPSTRPSRPERPRRRRAPARGRGVRRVRRAALPRRARSESSGSSAIAPTGGHGAGTADGSGIESLTERELQVARLVVDRKTNPEIAAELFLSQKTVETHLRNIFHKVGVTGRADLARAVERADETARPGPN